MSPEGKGHCECRESHAIIVFFTNWGFRMLILVFAVLTLVLGIYVLAKGEVALSSKKSVRGSKARIIGGLILLSAPLTVASVLLTIAIYGDTKDAPDYMLGLSIATLLGTPLIGIVLGFRWAE